MQEQAKTRNGGHANDSYKTTEALKTTVQHQHQHLDCRTPNTKRLLPASIARQMKVVELEGG